jgi:hypothetical protein
MVFARKLAPRRPGDKGWTARDGRREADGKGWTTVGYAAVTLSPGQAGWRACGNRYLSVGTDPPSQSSTVTPFMPFTQRAVISAKAARRGGVRPRPIA